MNFLKNNALTLLGLLIGVLFWWFNRAEFAELTNEKMQLIRLLGAGTANMERISENIVASTSEIAFLKKQNSKLLVGNTKLREKMHSLEGKIESHVVTVIDSVVLPADSAEIIRTATANMLKLPYGNTYKDRWVSFRQTIDAEGRNVIRNLTVQDSLAIYTYTAKRKLKELMQPRQTKVAIEPTNPYTQVRGIQSVIVKHQKKWYERPVLWGLVGFSAGIAVFMDKK